MRKIFIRDQDKTYKFLNYEFQDDRDGSLYIVFDRVGRGPGLTWASRTGNAPVEYQKEPEKFKISYHPCGHVRFHNVGGRPKSIHCEPIYAITKKQPLAYISIPSVASLDAADEPEEAEMIFDWPANIIGRVTVWIELGPPNLESPFEAGTMPIAGISYDRWFAIFVSLGSSPFPIPEGIPAEAVIKTVPDQDFVIERVTQEQAVINFHQARRGVRHEAVASFQPNSGVYRIIFAVPMRVPPELTVEFYDVNLSAEITHCTTYEVRFRVRGPGGYKMEWVPVKGFSLNADL